MYAIRIEGRVVAEKPSTTFKYDSSYSKIIIGELTDYRSTETVNVILNNISK